MTSSRQSADVEVWRRRGAESAGVWPNRRGSTLVDAVRAGQGLVRALSVADLPATLAELAQQDRPDRMEPGPHGRRRAKGDEVLDPDGNTV